MTNKERAALAVEKLKKLYPEALCALEYENDAWKLLVMARLSAQCTDKRVNLVCKELFKVFPNAEAMANGELSRIEELVHSCGLYRTKAKDIKECSRLIVEKHGGIIPDDMETLLSLPGVGRKIANLILGDLYLRPAVVTDTHCIRICGRLGFYPEELRDPYKVEKILVDAIEPEEQSDFCHRIVLFGRDICSARAPECQRCPLSDICKKHKDDLKG